MSSHENQGLSTIHINLAKGKIQLHERLQFFWAEISPLFMISLYLPKLVHIKPRSWCCITPWLGEEWERVSATLSPQLLLAAALSRAGGLRRLQDPLLTSPALFHSGINVLAFPNALVCKRLFDVVQSSTFMVALL